MVQDGKAWNMVIDEKITEGYVIICKNDHSFLAPRLGISVECPCCGEVALSVELASSYYFKKSSRDPIPSGV
ncbi:MAG: hypothetical protein AAF530_15335 [Pseudomonadota bacterium]